MSVASHTVLMSGNIFSSSSNYQPIDGSGGGLMTGMQALTNYTLSFSVARLDASTWWLTSTVSDTLMGEPLESYTVLTNSGVSTFNWMLLRFNSTIPTFNYTELKVSVDGPLSPEPSTLMLTVIGFALMGLVVRRRR